MNPIQQRLLALANTPADQLSTLGGFGGGPRSNPYNLHSAQHQEQLAAAAAPPPHHHHSVPRLDDGEPPQKRSRWNAPGTKAFIPGVPHLIPSGIDKECMEALLVRVRIEELTHSINTGQLGLDDPTIRRSPSPPPKYDSQGKRTNTREQRTKEKLTLERQSLIQIATKLNPAFKPPSDYRPINVKKTRKIRVPIDKYPDYNFIGLIIGPRGDTHKQLEKKSGAKISIRGKGSQKEGQAGKKFTGDEEEDLHVLITGDTDKQLDIAADMVEKLLVPIADEINEHKQLQLRSLAAYNGTLRDENYGRGGRRFGDQEDRGIVCGFCGEPSHPTSDCPMRNQPGAKSKMDREYESFLNEIGGGGSGGFPMGGSSDGGAKSSADDEYANFMASIGETPTSPQADAASAPAPWAKPRGAPIAPPAGGAGGGHYGPGGPMRGPGGASPMPPVMGGRGGYPPVGAYPQQGYPPYGGAPGMGVPGYPPYGGAPGMASPYGQSPYGMQAPGQYGPPGMAAVPGMGGYGAPGADGSTSDSGSAAPPPWQKQ